MANEGSLLAFLTEKPKRQADADQRFEQRFRQSVAEVFLPVVASIAKRQHLEYILKGGRGSCKSSFISCEILKILWEDPRGSALIIRKVGNTLRDSVYAQMLWAIDQLGLSEEWEATVSPMELTNKITGQKIMFRGLDEPRKLKSIKPRKGYFAVIWFEEADELDGMEAVRSVKQSGGRGKKARTITFLSFNPPKSANHWLNKEVAEDKPDRMVHHSTYEQVPRAWLGETFLAEAEALRERNPTAWRHEYGGEATGSGGAVFANLRIRPLTAEETAACRSHAMYGLDFGFSTDPSALMSTAFFARPDGSRALYVFEEYYKAGAGFDALERAIRRQCGKGQVWADTEPRTIAELAGRGLRIAAARKGKNSRQFGMQWLEEVDEIIIDAHRCPNAAREFAAFEHARNRDGSWRADYQDGNDHTIDAVRYSCWQVIFRSSRKKNYSGKGAR